MTRTEIIDKKTEILQWINEKCSKAEIARRLGCNVKTLKPAFEEMGIIYDGNQGLKDSHKSNGKRLDLINYLQNSQDIQSNKVRKKLLEEGYKEYKCECCGLSEWLGKPIPLELHHIDGNKHNNILENYSLLCPNCHAFTDSYRGKNIGAK